MSFLVYFSLFVQIIINGKKVEVVGIALDINVSVFSAEALIEDRDDAIETTVQLLN